MNTQYTITDTGVRSVNVNGGYRYEYTPVVGINFHERCEYIDKVITLSRSKNRSYHLFILTIDNCLQSQMDQDDRDDHTPLDVYLTQCEHPHERSDNIWNIYVPCALNVDALEYVKDTVNAWFDGTV